MKRLYIFFLIVCASISVGAQTTMRSVWLSMPDSIVPYLNRNLRMEHLDFVDMKVKSEVNNLMNGTCVMDTITSDYTHVALSPSSVLELRLLPLNDTTKIICMLKSFRGPVEESEISFCDTLWNPLEGMYGLDELKSPDSSETDFIQQFVHRPDTMTQERFDELSKLIDPVMLKAEMDVAEPVITCSLSVPLTTRKEKEQLNAILLQRRFRWEFGVFKEQ